MYTSSQPKKDLRLNSLSSRIIHIWGRFRRFPWDSRSDSRDVPILSGSSQGVMSWSMNLRRNKILAKLCPRIKYCSVSNEKQRNSFFNSIFITLCLLLTILCFWKTERWQDEGMQGKEQVISIVFGKIMRNSASAMYQRDVINNKPEI